jgi:hypothetical protein
MPPRGLLRGHLGLPSDATEEATAGTPLRLPAALPLISVNSVLLSVSTPKQVQGIVTAGYLL